MDGSYKVTTELNARYYWALNGGTANCGLMLISAYDFTWAGIGVRSLGNGYYTIGFEYQNMAITADNTPTAFFEPYNSSESQMWEIQAVGDGSYQIISKLNGLYLDVSNANAIDGNKVGLFQKNDAYDAQKWIFTKVD